jgi:hypothetical protein
MPEVVPARLLLPAAHRRTVRGQQLRPPYLRQIKFDDMSDRFLEMARETSQRGRNCPS